MASETGRPFFDMLSININDTLQDNEHIAIENSVNIASDTSLNDTTISGELNVYGNTIMESDLSINGDLFVGGTIQVDLSQNFAAGDNITFTQVDTSKVITIALNTDDDISFNSNVDISDDLVVGGDISMNGDLFVGGTISTTGAIDISGDLVVGGDISMNGDLLVGGKIQGDLSQNFVAGDNITMTQDDSSKAITIALNTNIDIRGDLTLNGNLKGKFLSYDISQLGDDIFGDAPYDYSGYSVSLSSDGTRVAIETPSYKYVKVYEWNKTETDASWVKMGDDIGGTVFGTATAAAAPATALAPGDLVTLVSRSSVSLSSNGTRVAIGDPYNNINNNGHVRIYEWNKTETDASWTQLGEDIVGDAAGDKSGASVSLSSHGTRVAIGAPNNGAGHVKVYEYVDASWAKMGDDIDGDAAYDYSGYSVSLSSDGTRVAIGAPNNNAGHVRIYQWNETETETDASWVKMGDDIVGDATYDYSGYSVSLSSNGSIVAIGAPYNDDNGSKSGHVRIYEWNETDASWTQLGDIAGDATNDYSGYSVSLSSDGTRVAMGAPNNGAGHVKVYEYVDASWVQLVDIGGTVFGDSFGTSVSLSSDGTSVAIGAPKNDAGHVKIYEIIPQYLLEVDGDISMNGDLVVGGDISMNGDLVVDGTITAQGQVSGASLFSSGSISTTSGSISTSSGDIITSTGTISAGTISTTGQIDIGGDLEVAGNLSLSGNLNGEQFIRVVAMAIVDADGTIVKAVGCKVELYDDKYECTFTPARPTNSYVVNYTPYITNDSPTLINHSMRFNTSFSYYIYTGNGSNKLTAAHSFTVFDTDGGSSGVF